MADDIASVLERWANETHDFALLVLSPEARVTWANDAVARVLGYTPAELKGKSLRMIFTPEDLQRGLDQHELDVARKVGRAEDDRWHVCKDGSRVFCNGILTCLMGTDAGVAGFIKVFRDRTDVRTQTETLENRLSEAERLARSKDTFLSTLAHELRNPINAILSGAALIRRAQDADHIRQATEIVERQAATAARLIDDLLDATRMDVGHLRLNIEPLNLQDAISSAVALQSPAVQAKRQVMQVVLPEVPIALEADPVRLEQILRNVLDNSIKYTPASGHLWVTATVEADKAVIRIQDDGDGMDAETLPKVFEMFTRGEKAMDSASDGLGIGLAVVKNLVQLHGGIIEVQSGGQGRGTEFTLKFPLAQKDARLEPE